MKYIDADKLIAEVERYKQGAAIARFDNAGENAEYFLGKVDLCDDLTHIISSLQQVQPVPHWIHANYSDKPEIRYTPSGTPYLQNGPHMIWLSDLERLPKDGTDLTNPKQEQPEVELENIIRVEFGTRAKVEDGRRYVKLDWDNFSILARHFYSLGLNARKEEE